MTAALTVGITADEVKQLVCERVAMWLEDGMLGVQIRQAMERELGEQINALVAERVVPEVERVLREGWQTYDDYGTPRGQVTLASMIGKWCNARDGYRGKNIEAAIKEAIEKLVRDEGKEQLDAIRRTIGESLKGQVSDIVRAELGSTLAALLKVAR